MGSIPPNLKSKFELCLNNDDLSDCEFLVGKPECRIKGHKLLFGLSSPVFRSMLYEDFKNVTFRIEDVEVDEFNGMKQFFYTENVNFTSSLYACSLYLASWKYVIPDLMAKCVQYIEDNITVMEVIDVYEFSRVHNIPDIETICTAVFRDKTSELMDNERFLSADIDTLETILKLDSLNLKSEMEVFKHTERWVHAEAARRNIESQNLAEHFNYITRHIRFSKMDKDQYEEGLAHSDLLTVEEKLSIAHILMGIKSKNQLQLTAVEEHRIFTGKEEEKEKSEGGEREETEVEKEETEVEKEDDTKRNKSSNTIKPIPIPTNAEKFEFIFTKLIRTHSFKYQGYDFEIQYEGKTFEDPLDFTTFVVTLINKNKIKLHSVERVKTVKSYTEWNNTYFENASKIEEESEHIFRYLPIRLGVEPKIVKILFELNLLKLE